MMSALERCCNPKSPELQRLERTFNKLDTDNIGAIRPRVLNAALERDFGPELDDEQKRALLAHTQKKKDGYIDFKEFVSATQTPQSADGSLTETVLFRAADVVIPINQRRSVYNYLKEYRCCPPPIFMLCISIAEVSVFLYYALRPGPAPGWLQGCPGCIVQGKVGPLVYNPRLKHEAWRYVSYMLIHAGISHLVGNVIVQLLLGVPLELVHRLWRVGPLYVAGVLMGSLLQSAVDPNVSLVGASGGCYALLTAHLANVILNWREMPFRWVRLCSVTLFVGTDVSFVIYRRFYLGECDQVSYMAHVGGALAGLLLGLFVLRNLLVLKWEKAVSIVCLVIFILLLITCIVLNIVFKPAGASMYARCK